ncbi:MAG: DUF3090 family protein [Candidatus Limnocylindrales bacterium]
MSRRIYRLDAPDRFVAGAVGQPGQRAFFLQARQGGTLVTVALEKVQVAVLAERLLALVGEMRRRGLDVAAGPPADAEGSLEEPLVEAFRAGTLSLTWDGEHPAVQVEAAAASEEEEAAGDDEDDEASEVSDVPEWADEDPEGPDLLRVSLAASTIEAFARHAESVVAAGRPRCPLCGQPLDPQGHLCPRRNGHGALLH